MLSEIKTMFKTFTIIIIASMLAAEADAAVTRPFTVTKKIEISDGLTLRLQFRGAEMTDTGTGGYDRINVLRTDSRLLQTIDISEINPYGDKFTSCPEPGSGNDIIMEDMNFDGIMDFRIIAMTTPGPNVPYICFLWDRKSSRFIHAEFLDDITSPEFDGKRKVIRSSSRDGADLYTENIYRYIGNKLILTDSTVTEYKKLKDQSGKVALYEIKTVKKFLDGKMKVIRTEKTKKS